MKTGDIQLTDNTQYKSSHWVERLYRNRHLCMYFLNCIMQGWWIPTWNWDNAIVVTHNKILSTYTHRTVGTYRHSIRIYRYGRIGPGTNRSTIVSYARTLISSTVGNHVGGAYDLTIKQCSIISNYCAPRTICIIQTHYCCWTCRLYNKQLNSHEL